MPPLLVAAVVTVVYTVSPGRKSLVGLKVTVLPLTLATPRVEPNIRPPRCWLNTRTARWVAVVFAIVAEKVTATLLVAAALRRLRVGLRAVMVIGAAVTVKVLPVAVPPGVTTLTAPVVLPAPTVKVRLVAVLAVMVPAVPFTRAAVAPVRLVPVIVTLVPTGPLGGVKLVMVGAGAWLRRTLTLSLKLLVATKSKSPSPSTSPRATLVGWSPTAGAGLVAGAVKLPVPLLSRTFTLSMSKLVVTKSRSPSLSISPRATLVERVPMTGSLPAENTPVLEPVALPPLRRTLTVPAVL